MAQPTAYNRQASFTNIQAQAPSDPLPGATLDIELNAIKVTLDGLRTNIALLQRDDGELANESVGLDQLSEEIEVGWEAPEVWVTTTAYTVGNTVFETAGFYRCLVAHTSGTFATDLAADKWELIVDLSGIAVVDADQIAFTPAGTIAATDVQAALEELSSEKAASSHTHPSSAITDSTAAGRNMLSAANVAAQQALLLLGDLAFEDTIPVTDIDANLALSGIIEPAALASDTNDWAPTGIATCSTIRMSASATGIDLTGLLAPATDGEIKILENVGTTYSITLQPSSASSAAANRFLVQRPIVIGPNQSVVLRYDIGDARWRLFDRAGSLPKGHIHGLHISNNSGDATNDIDIAVGECRGELNLLDLVLSTAMTKQLDADWAAGTNAGGRYVTSANNPAIADTTYHTHLIGKADGTIDVIFYTGASASAILPSGYIDCRRIGSYTRSTSIRPFAQNGDEFLLKTPLNSYSNTPANTNAVTQALTGVPTGVKFSAMILGYVRFATTGAGMMRVFSPDQTDAAVDAINTTVRTFGSDAGNVDLPVLTDTSAQIKFRLNAVAGSDTVQINCRGWTDRRGKDA